MAQVLEGLRKQFINNSVFPLGPVLLVLVIIITKQLYLSFRPLIVLPIGCAYHFVIRSCCQVIVSTYHFVTRPCFQVVVPLWTARGIAAGERGAVLVGSANSAPPAPRDQRCLTVPKQSGYDKRQQHEQ